MTDDTPRPEPTAARRRYPLTLTALVGSALAIPVYLTIGADEAPTIADAQIASTPVTAEAEAPAAAEILAPTKTSTAPTTPAPEAEPPPPPASASAPKESIHRGTEGTMGKPSGSGYGAGSLGLVGTGRGGGGSAMPGSAMPKPKRSRARRSKGTKSKSGLYAMKGPAAPSPAMADSEAPPMDEDAGYDDNLRAGQLTAGAIDDRTSTKLLDELRSKATGLDRQLAQAVPSHKARGVAPAAGQPTAPVLEIGFVLDTTGSMGDELQYLKTEIRSIAEQIGREHPNVQQRYALVTYRDQTDEYLVRHHDFEPLDSFVDHLGTYGAGGGGDFPEAMDQGMQTASALSWSTEGAAKIAFLVADAPPHAEGYANYVHATGSLASKGVSVYPVASSGVEPICEYLMRWAARTTGGTYLFLTDHSGIGNAHADPHADDYELKSLRDHMLDVIRAELGNGEPTAEPQAPTTQVSVHVDMGHGPTWWGRHGLFFMLLGGVFLMGFAGDMALSSVRRRR